MAQSNYLKKSFESAGPRAERSHCTITPKTTVVQTGVNLLSSSHVPESHNIKEVLHPSVGVWHVNLTEPGAFIQNTDPSMIHSSSIGDRKVYTATIGTSGSIFHTYTSGSLTDQFDRLSIEFVSRLPRS